VRARLLLGSALTRLLAEVYTQAGASHGAHLCCLRHGWLADDRIQHARTRTSTHFVLSVPQLADWWPCSARPITPSSCLPMRSGTKTRWEAQAIKAVARHLLGRVVAPSW